METSADGIFIALLAIRKIWDREISRIEEMQDFVILVITTPVGPLGIVSAALHSWMCDPERSLKTGEIYCELAREGHAPSLENVGECLLLNPDTLLTDIFDAPEGLERNTSTIGDIPIHLITYDLVQDLCSKEHAVKSLEADSERLIAKVRVLLNFFRGIIISGKIRSGMNNAEALKKIDQVMPYLKAKGH